MGFHHLGNLSSKSSVDAPSCPNLKNYGHIALKRKQGLQQDKDFMAPNLRRNKHSWPMSGNAREKEENIITINIKVEDQSLLHIKKRRRRIYRKYNASRAINMVTMKINFQVQAKENMKPQ